MAPQKGHEYQDPPPGKGGFRLGEGIQLFTLPPWKAVSGTPEDAPRHLQSTGSPAPVGKGQGSFQVTCV